MGAAVDVGAVSSAEMGARVPPESPDATASFGARVPVPASQMFSSNLYNFIEHFWNEETKSLNLDMDDEIIQGCLITDKGQIVNNTLKQIIQETGDAS